MNTRVKAIQERAIELAQIIESNKETDPQATISALREMIRGVKEIAPIILEDPESLDNGVYLEFC